MPSLFQQLVNFLKGDAPAEKQAADLRTAVAVLLLEAAHRDDEFGPEERAVIERLLTQKFALSKEECAELMASCEATISRMVQLHPYTHAIFERMDPADRIQFIEMLWEVVYADGVLDPEEDALIRRVGGLIYVTDRDRMLARKRVLERMGRTESESAA
jgi:uncharacterized tellurite resistance protein B-like protein